MFKYGTPSVQIEKSTGGGKSTLIYCTVCSIAGIGMYGYYPGPVPVHMQYNDTTTARHRQHNDTTTRQYVVTSASTSTAGTVQLEHPEHEDITDVDYSL